MASQLPTGGILNQILFYVLPFFLYIVPGISLRGRVDLRILQIYWHNQKLNIFCHVQLLIFHLLLRYIYGFKTLNEELFCNNNLH